MWTIIILIQPGIDSTELATLIALEQALQPTQQLPNQNIDEALEQKKRELKSNFEHELVASLSSDGKIKNFEMTKDDSIEKRAINREQIDYLIDITRNRMQQ